MSRAGYQIMPALSRYICCCSSSEENIAPSCSEFVGVNDIEFLEENSSPKG